MMRMTLKKRRKEAKRKMKKFFRTDLIQLLKKLMKKQLSTKDLYLEGTHDLTLNLKGSKKGQSQRNKPYMLQEQTRLNKYNFKEFKFHKSKLLSIKLT